MIGLLQIFWTVLWGFLLIIPGIINAMAYSQAIYIYRDSVDQGEAISYRTAIRQSRQLMDGFKCSIS